MLVSVTRIDSLSDKTVFCFRHSKVVGDQRSSLVSENQTPQTNAKNVEERWARLPREPKNWPSFQFCLPFPHCNSQLFSVCTSTADANTMVGFSKKVNQVSPSITARGVRVLRLIFHTKRRPRKRNCCRSPNCHRSRKIESVLSHI